MKGTVPVTGNPDADELNATNPLALLISLLLDQHTQKEKTWKPAVYLLIRR